MLEDTGTDDAEMDGCLTKLIPQEMAVTFMLVSFSLFFFPRVKAMTSYDLKVRPKPSMMA